MAGSRMFMFGEAMCDLRSDLRAQDVLAVLELARLHVAEDRQRFVAPGGCETANSLPGCAEVAAVGGHVFGALAVAHRRGRP